MCWHAEAVRSTFELVSDCTFVSSRFWFSSEVVCFGDRLQQSCFTSARAQDAELRPRLAQEKDRVLRALFFTW